MRLPTFLLTISYPELRYYLEKEGLVIREEHDGFPPLVQYSLTSLAKAFLLEISYVIEWGQLHFEEITSKRSYGKN